MAVAIDGFPVAFRDPLADGSATQLAGRPPVSGNRPQSVSMGNLSANLSALESVLGRNVRLPETDGRVSLETGGPTPVLLLSMTGGAVALNSRRDPVGEARKLLDEGLSGRPDPKVVVVVGVGLGFLIDAIEVRCPGAKILALEPEAACIRPLLERRDLSALLSARRLMLLWGPDYHGASDGSYFLGDGDQDRLTIVHPALSRHRADEFAAAATVLERIVFGARSNAEARKKFAGRYLLNTLRNVPIIGRSGDVGSLFGMFGGVPGVIVSAGPSLDENIHALTHIADDAVVITADTALRPLLSAGIHPHMVVAVDPSEVNGRHLRDLPDTGATHLVAEGSIEPAAFEEFGDRVFVFRVSDHHPWPWLREHGLDRAALRAWGSVATSAFDLAMKLGCDPIVFVGQDLAFTGGQPYCRGTTFEYDWADLMAGGMTLDEIWRDWLSGHSLATVADIHGRATRTTPVMVAFRDWLAEQCAGAARECVNATGAGILMGPAIRQAALEEAVPRRGAASAAFAAIRAARARQGVGSPGTLDDDRAVQTVSRALPDGLADAWRAFSGSTITLRDIRSALRIPASDDDITARLADTLQLPRHRLTAMTQLRGLADRRFLPSTSLRRERVKAIRAPSTSGVDAYADQGARGQDAPARGDLPAALLREATEALSRLLSLETPATGLLPGFGDIGSMPSESVSLTAPFDWVPEARADVDLLEHLIRTKSQVGQAAAPQDDLGRFRWSVPTSRQPQPQSAPHETLLISLEQLRWWARRALVVEWATLLPILPARDEATMPGASQHLAEWIRDLADGPYPVALDESSVILTGRLRGTGPDSVFTFDLRTPPWRLMRAMTGAVAPIPGSRPASEGRLPGAVVETAPDCCGKGLPYLSCSLGTRDAPLPGVREPRDRFFSERTGWILPVLIGLPTSYRLGTRDLKTALVTPFMADHSIAVDDRGHWERLPRWPRAIVGEARGRGGHSVAWSGNLAWYLMRRRGDHGHVETAVPPFRPTRGVVADDGTSYWGAQTGGLWRWATSGELDCVAATPPIAGLHLTAQGLRLDPNPVDPSSRWQRTATDVGWIWHFATHRLEPFDLTMEGPMSKLEESRDTWAAAYPAADIIRIGDGGGAQRDIACEWPVDLAWAGDSLVAVTGHGHVLLFQDLAERPS